MLLLYEALLSFLRDGATRDIVTYGELKKRSGVAVIGRNLGPYLTRIGVMCEVRELRRLDALVVTKKTGEPGHGFKVSGITSANRESGELGIGS